MITARQNALEKILQHFDQTSSAKPCQPSQNFGKLVFSKHVMQKMLPKKIFDNILLAIHGKAKFEVAYADAIALAMKEWAISHGATHYCHWFQPLTGTVAEKHDSFLDWKNSDSVIEKFCGEELIRGEPDASSFPSGGLRNTYEARGYTSWDPTTPAFLWKLGSTYTLCIPSIFFSWTGDVLDTKIPLLRSDEAINIAALRLLDFTGISAKKVFSTLGCEQEYFILDRSLFQLRPDLLILGKTVFGAEPPKGQELSDHYFGTLKERVINFMQDFENVAIELGIPVKTRHNEVAPAQHEIAVFFEKAVLSVDHNIQLMEIMKKTAVKHHLACLLHEKPFAKINGSGKHHNWSLATDTGLNLLDPSKTPENNLHFLLLLVAVLQAVYEHSELLRACIGTLSNDARLGGHEAPPAIISVYLGDALEELLDHIETKGSYQSKALEKIELGLKSIFEMPKHNTDRNRTSPFAFTGNKFEFRAVGSSISPAFPVTVINTIVASHLNQILDRLEKALPKTPLSQSEKLKHSIPVIREVLKETKPIRFSGDNYAAKWHEEAKKRGLPNIKRSFTAYSVIKQQSTIDVFNGILNQQELECRYQVYIETYIKQIHIEAKLMVDLFKTSILPATMDFQNQVASSITSAEKLGVSSLNPQKHVLEELSQSLSSAIEAIYQLDATRKKFHLLDQSNLEQIHEDMQKARIKVDHLETLVDDKKWPLPKYQELLFIL